MEKDELQEYLDALGRNDCYRVDAVLKDSSVERTERVFFQGTNGSELGPFIRKTITNESGQGSVYEKLFRAQQKGKRFAHLPRLFECYQTGSSLVVVMEFVHGATLQESLEQRGASLAFAREVFPALCDAASELHESFDPPVIHRDLTPANIIVSSGDVTLIDLGIARTFSPGATRDTTFLGTREFASPEQYGFCQTDIRSDVFSLGKVLNYCLGGMPFDLVASGLSKTEASRLKWVIDSATSLDPNMRFQSAAELKQAFLEALDNELHYQSMSDMKAVLLQADERSADEPSLAAAATKPCVPDLPAPDAATRVAAFTSDVATRVESSIHDVMPASVSISGSPPVLAATPVFAPDVASPTANHRTAATDRPPARLATFLRRIPAPLGIVWNVVLLLFWALIFVAANAVIVMPSGQVAGYPLWYRIIGYYGFIVVPTTTLVYYLFDMRRFRAKHPGCRFVSRSKMPLMVFLIAMVVAIVATAAAGIAGVLPATS